MCMLRGGSRSKKTPPLLFSLLLGVVHFGAGCASATASPDRTPAVRGDYVALDAQPSPNTAALLPTGAKYRVVVAAANELALIVVGPDARIVGRLRIRPIPVDSPGPAASIVLDDCDGPPARVDAWSTAGGVYGEVTVGGRSAHWRVELGVAGDLVGQRWSTKHGPESVELTELRRARALSADLRMLEAELPTSERELTELLAFVELALELSVRAWEGRGRADLQRDSSLVASVIFGAD